MEDARLKDRGGTRGWAITGSSDMTLLARRFYNRIFAPGTGGKKNENRKRRKSHNETSWLNFPALKF